MSAKSAGHDEFKVPEDRAHSASRNRPNQKGSLEQKINRNSELNLSWADQLEELQNDGVVFDRDTKVIYSGPEKSAVTSEASRRDPRLIIPNDPSKFPGFPTDMSKFETATAFGEAVLRFWGLWRKQKSKERLHAKREAERAAKMANMQKVAGKNEKVVGADEKRRSHSDQLDSRADRSRSRGPPSKKELISKLHLPGGQNQEARDIIKKIENLPVALLSDPELVSNCRTEAQKVGGCTPFWRRFFEADFGLKVFKEKQLEAEEARTATKRRLHDRSAPPRPQPRQAEPQQQHKRQKRVLVPEEQRQFAVYVEKFDKEKKVKMTGTEYDAVKFEVFNAWWLESQEMKDKLQDSCDLRLFSSERGEATFFATSTFGQDFIIHAVNEKAKLPGIKARGPRIESKPNLHFEFSDTLNKFSPEVAIKMAIKKCANIDCEPIIRAVKPNPRSRGKTISIELPNDKLAKLLSWSVDNGRDYVKLYMERLRFWTYDKPEAVQKSAAEFSSMPKISATSTPSAGALAAAQSIAETRMDTEATGIDEVRQVTTSGYGSPFMAASAASAFAATEAVLGQQAKPTTTMFASTVSTPSTKSRISPPPPLWQTHHEVPADWESRLKAEVSTPKPSNAAKMPGLLPENCPDYGNCPRGPKCGYWHIGLAPGNLDAATSKPPMTPTPVMTPVRPRFPPSKNRTNSGDYEMEDPEIIELLSADSEGGSKFEVSNHKTSSATVVKAPSTTGMVPGVGTGTAGPSDEGGLAVDRPRRLCTLTSRSRSLSTTSNRRSAKRSGEDKSSDGSLKPLVASKQKPKCQRKVSDFFPKN